MYSPRWLFLIPGGALIALGLLGYAVAMPGLRIGTVKFDAHTLLFASLALMLGYQSILFAGFSKVFAINQGLLPEDPRSERFFRVFTLERGLVAGAVGLVVGIALLVVAVLQWREQGFGDLDYSRTMRWVIPGVTLTAGGLLTVLSSFFISILRLEVR